MSDYFVFGDYTSHSDNVLFLSDSIEGASPDFALEKVAGRSGALLRSNNRIDNRKRTLIVYAPTDGYATIEEVENRLLENIAYQRLESTIYPDIYMMAQFDGKATYKKSVGMGAVRASFNFVCKPQKYLKSGETAQTIADGGSLVNPTRFPAKPLLYVEGVGEIGIGSYTVELLESLEDCVIDCEFGHAYNSETLASYNDKVRFTGGYPQLNIGTTGFTLASGITSFQVVPRWWKL